LSIIDIICLSYDSVLSDQAKLGFSIIEYICVIWFTIEVLTRFAICPKKWKFLANLYNILDALSVIPFYIYLCMQSSTLLKSIKGFSRILRIVSTIKIFQNYDKLKTLGNTVANSLTEITVYCCYLAVGVLVFSSLLWLCENELPDTKYTSIPASFWWAVIEN